MPPVNLSEQSLAGPNGVPRRPAFAYFADAYTFHWDEASFRSDWAFVIAVAVCLVAGLAAGHPGGALIAAGGAMTAGFGVKQNIGDSRLVPIFLVSVGMAVSTFLGMAAGHEGWSILFIASLFGFGYGLLSKSGAGYVWVTQQCVVTLLVASAFPSTLRGSLVRASLVCSGGLVQLLFSALVLRSFHRLGDRIHALARYMHDQEQTLRSAYLEAVSDLRQRRWRDSPIPYALRLAVTLAISTEIYRALHFASGYWIPMTALLVLRPGVADTANRAVARTLGTLAGAVLASLFSAYVHPPTLMNALLVLLFTYLAYSVNNVNYGLFSVCLTAYIVFLLSLAQDPGPEIARRRFVCTFIGGALALSVRLCVIQLRRRQDLRSSTPTGTSAMAERA